MAITIILICGALALITALFYSRRVLSVVVTGKDSKETARLLEISGAISEGAMAFLLRQYSFVALFAILFAVLIYFALGIGHTGINEGLFSAGAFLAGAATSCLCAFIGMKIATKGNVRTTVMARQSIGKAFDVAFSSGAVMGFGLAGMAVLALLGMYYLFAQYITDVPILMDVLAGFGLGGSTVALFGRVGGGIYTKAADVGADLVGKVEQGIPEDDPRNPAVIADNVGDNVGDVAGMGADLFGSCAEGICAALLIGASSAQILASDSATLYPLLLTAVGIPVCIITALFAKVSDTGSNSVEPALKRQLLLSTVLMTVAIIFTTKYFMVPEFTLGEKLVTANGVLASVLCGLWSGLLIGYVTEYYTSHAYNPVREVANASQMGHATNIIYGLSLGYKSTAIPVLALAITVYVSFSLAGMYGIALAAIGMISTVAIGLTIDAYGPVSDNAGGIAEMSHLGAEVRSRTDLLDAAGNTTAAIGKGFAIGSAVLTALALFAAFLTRSDIVTLNLLSPLVMSGLLIGGVLPSIFTAQTMKAVGRAALSMIEEVRRQFRTIPGLLEGTGRPDYRGCVAISTTAALKEMVAPAVLVLGTPLFIGTLFGVEMLAGVLMGSLVAGVVKALSSSNAGGAWDNAKKYIEGGEHGGKGSDAYKAAVVGDTVGDPFKDTSGPSLNILMKLMAILSLVFAPFFVAHGGIFFRFFGI